MAQVRATPLVKNAPVVVQTDHGEEVHHGRLDYPGTGLDIATTDLGSFANFGTSPSVSSVSGTETRGTVNITSGSGVPTINASVTLTFPGGAFAAAPQVFIRETSAGKIGFYPGTVNTTSAQFKVAVAPSASTAYSFEFVVLPV